MESAGISANELAFRERLRALIASQTLPPKPPTAVFAGPAYTNHYACILCAEKIKPGETEYEWSMGKRVLYIHRQCFALWHEVHDRSA